MGGRLAEVSEEAKKDFLFARGASPGSDACGWAAIRTTATASSGARREQRHQEKEKTVAAAAAAAVADDDDDEEEEARENVVLFGGCLQATLLLNAHTLSPSASCFCSLFSLLCFRFLAN